MSSSRTSTSTSVSTYQQQILANYRAKKVLHGAPRNAFTLQR
jgi:hypothetical protein